MSLAKQPVCQERACVHLVAPHFLQVRMLEREYPHQHPVPDWATSVLDLNCRAHEVHNLYVVDSSFFPSDASVSPGLTVIANALRVGDRLIEQLN